MLRIEDTDRERSKKEFEKDILDGLRWLGLNWDNKKIERQSQRAEIYRKHLVKLLEEDRAYLSKKENEGGKGEIIRLRNPGRKISFSDLIRGEIEFNTAELGDFVIARSEAEPLYHLAAVVDDFEMEITHVIRGEDHISNTPRQILIQEALGFSRPAYAHIPLILAPDHSKLSKRHGAVSLLEYRERGYLPEAMVNFLALLGWHPTGVKELHTLEELVSEFRLEKVQKGGAIFDARKLDWLNREYMRHLPKEKLISAAAEYLPGIARERLSRALPAILERAHTFGEIKEKISAGEFAFFFERLSYSEEGLIPESGNKTETLSHLRTIAEKLSTLPEDEWSAEAVKATVFPYAEAEGRGAVLWPMRYALSGREKSPDPFTLAAVLGREETLERLSEAREKLESDL